MARSPSGRALDDRDPFWSLGRSLWEVSQWTTFSTVEDGGGLCRLVCVGWSLLHPVDKAWGASRGLLNPSPQPGHHTLVSDVGGRGSVLAGHLGRFPL